MWTLLAAELRARTPITLSILASIATGFAVLAILGAPRATVLDWVVSAVVLLPLLVNGLAGAAEARDHRAHLLHVLPVTSREVALVRLAVPALVQIAGTCLAAMIAIVAAITGDLSPGVLLRVVWLGPALVVLGLWLALQREMVAGRRRSGAVALAWGVGALAAAAAVLGASLAVVWIVGRLVGLPGAALAWVAMLPTAGALLVLDLELSVRRDPVAA